jgi:hypothetical protein
MLRKRATPAPAFKQPAPYGPMGAHAPLGVPGLNSRMAIFQVVEEDTYGNYLICRGWDIDKDPTCRYGLERVAVAKPFSVRGTYPYAVAQLITAMKPRTIFGDNSGDPSVSTGQPADLNEAIEMLKDDSGNPIWWMAMERSAAMVSRGDSGGAGPGTSLIPWTEALVSGISYSIANRQFTLPPGRFLIVVALVVDVSDMIGPDNAPYWEFTAKIRVNGIADVCTQKSHFHGIYTPAAISVVGGSGTVQLPTTTRASGALALTYLSTSTAASCFFDVQVTMPNTGDNNAPDLLGNVSIIECP